MRKQKTVTVGLVLLIIFCWPLGVGLLIYRLYINKAQVIYEDGAALTKAGWGLAIVGVLFFMMGLRNVPAFLFFVVAGAFVLYYGNRVKRKGKKFHLYALVVENTGSAPISEIAAAMGTSYDEALADLTAMIEQGYFLKAYIDQKTKRLVLLDDKGAGRAGQKRVECPGCGAAVTLSAGERAVCAYCDSPLDST
ncbi:MAG: PCI domain-containing protein [Gracilibacteraceae bacterium]|nr:PCI domain-containing protein [Gracilibacteraceae bacterium]